MKASERHVDLDELKLWRSDPEGLSAGERARRDEIGSHLEQCAECSEIAEAHTLISGVSKAGQGSTGCPRHEVWLEVAANLVSEAEGKGYVQHAAGCSRCAEELKFAMDAVAGDAIEPEVEGLATSTAQWQREMARRLKEMSAPALHRSAPAKRKGIRRWWPAMAFAFAALLVAAFFVGTWYVRGPGMNAQMARAADALRLTELHIPGARAVALRIVRSDAKKPEWPELLEVRTEALKHDEESPYWRQVLGRTYVLQNDPASALSEFQTAYLKDPLLEGIEFDLGTAYFELGVQSGNKSNYGMAAEHFTKSIGKERRDAAAFFNRALCEERMSMSDRAAREDLESALKLEEEPDWQEAIRKQLAELSNGGGAQSRPPVEAGGERYEDALTKVFEDAPGAGDLGEVAREGEKRGDGWLADWLRERGGDRALLGEAVKANQAGDAEKALEAARRARVAYAQSGSRAGFARAQVEEIYALQRMGRARECMELIQSPKLVAAVRGYAYLGTMLLLEAAACEEMAGAMQRSKQDIDEARAAAEKAGFPALYARAQGFLAGYYTLKGAPEDGWNADVSGLAYCREHGCSALRRYQFVSDLIDDAVSLGLDWFAVSLAREGVELAGRAGNVQNTAYAWEILGQRELACGMTAEAEDAFSHADGLLGQLGDNAATRAYRADWAADRADLLTRQGRGALAVERLEAASRDVSSAESLLLQLNYWSRRALAEHASGQRGAALVSARNAVEFAEQVRRGLTTYADRQAWRANARMGYVTLVESLAESGHAEEALRAWEAYETATDESKITVRGNARGPALIFARLIDVYARFTLEREGGVAVRFVAGNADAIEQLARTFKLLCSDPHSRLSEARQVGRSLYSILLADEASGRHDAELRIQASGALDKLPLGALVLPDGRYLATHRAVTQLSSSWMLRPEAREESFSASVPLLILRTESAEAGAIPASYDETAELVKVFPRARVVDGGDEDRGAFLRSVEAAEIFHFSGHAVNGQGATRLLLTTGPGRRDGSLTADWLDGISLGRTRLAVLAACSTAGSAEWTEPRDLDLAEAFLHAGTGAVVASLWDVDSEATRSLMIGFYRELAKGISPAAALDQAQAALSESASFQHPYFWSGFRVLQ